MWAQSIIAVTERYLIAAGKISAPALSDNYMLPSTIMMSVDTASIVLCHIAFASHYVIFLTAV